MDMKDPEQLPTEIMKKTQGNYKHSFFCLALIATACYISALKKKTLEVFLRFNFISRIMHTFAMKETVYLFL